VILLEAEHMRSGLATDLKQVSEALGRDQGNSGATTLEQRIGGHSRPVGKALDRPEINTAFGAQGAQTVDDGPRGVGWCRRNFVDEGDIRFVIERVKIRKSSAYVNTDSPRHTAVSNERTTRTHSPPQAYLRRPIWRSSGSTSS
jgi:hypothetical protein